MTAPLIGSLGTPEMLIILAVVVLLFGASKLPELARGSGRALRIFKAETKGLNDDDNDNAAGELPEGTPGETGKSAVDPETRRDNS
ncbi:Sec-independent protein translocase subunit TatA [Nocardioides alcanivorans]|uniref:Sec-independent protein translocase subunit TatA n=1 Tax=Nocardioides alcanivorans TaxID=2897352 RepID=UPI0024B15071|nr:Sec-independent protein translocase subunit TatA [Nocardioides alcanivorans]